MSASFVGECARFLYSSTTTKTVTVPITAAVAVGSYLVLCIDVPGNTANTTCTVSDSHAGSTNVYSARQFALTNGAGSNGQSIQVTCPITTGLTTSDTLTVTVNNTGSTVWAVLGLNFTGLLDYDLGTSSNGAAGTAMDTGATSAASQNQQVVVAAFTHTGSGVVISNITPAGFTAQSNLTTTTTIRELTVIWGIVNASGTRQVTASQDASHAWGATLVAINVDVPPTITFTKTITVG
jgi:hypothetical protein